MFDEEEDAEGICPVCGRVVCLNEDGTLWNHFTSFLNQDDPSQPICIGAGMIPLSHKGIEK